MNGRRHIVGSEKSWHRISVGERIAMLQHRLCVTQHFYRCLGKPTPDTLLLSFILGLWQRYTHILAYIYACHRDWYNPHMLLLQNSVTTDKRFSVNFHSHVLLDIPKQQRLRVIT